ncbi:hypothetical protein C8E05_6025 [Rhodococcus wratislaviensis]|uniref:Transposase n=1 Tax=Rhodococcus wratislaviensis TaxID=44752 RepID=A0AB38F8D3_RHOWR|nr:hypothetical protein C8E05_6025 [Rhodococcus wratislaviensis]SPZ36200.1 Uncharacterised protein [Rhodococcus wratislaviensis]
MTVLAREVTKPWLPRQLKWVCRFLQPRRAAPRSPTTGQLVWEYAEIVVDRGDHELNARLGHTQRKGSLGLQSLTAGLVRDLDAVTAGADTAAQFRRWRGTPQ